MPIERSVVDANVLAYAVNSDAPQQRASRVLLESALNPVANLYVTSQILCEFYSLVTNRKRVPTVSPPAEAVQMITELLELPGLRVLPSPVGAVAKLVELLKYRPVLGGDVFDLQIVATMLANDVRRIYTFNVRDFRIFPELSVISP